LHNAIFNIILSLCARRDREKQHAVNYALKPFTTERLNEALERVVEKNTPQRATAMLDGFPIRRDTPRPGTPRIAIKAKGRILFIDVLQIASVQAEGNYVLLQTGPRSYLLRQSLAGVVEKLKPYGFIRIHRSFLVNGSMVEEMYPCANGEYRVRLKGGSEYPVARSYRKNLKWLADFWIGSKGFLGD
jgi:DNA-binding LytR/AlgR family response regulator